MGVERSGPYQCGIDGLKNDGMRGDSLIMESEVAATASGCLDFRTSFTEVEMEEFPTTSLR